MREAELKRPNAIEKPKREKETGRKKRDERVR